MQTPKRSRIATRLLFAVVGFFMMGGSFLYFVHNAKQGVIVVSVPLIIMFCAGLIALVSGFLGFERRKPMPETISGIVTLYLEQETEGHRACWNFMDARYMSGARWDYAGLYVLEDGDHLTIYSKENPDKIVWSGTVKLGVNELSSSQEGIDHAQWLEWFQNEHPAWLIPVRPRTVV